MYLRNIFDTVVENEWYLSFHHNNKNIKNDQLLTNQRQRFNSGEKVRQQNVKTNREEDEWMKTRYLEKLALKISKAWNQFFAALALYLSFFLKWIVESLNICRWIERRIIVIVHFIGVRVNLDEFLIGFLGTDFLHGNFTVENLIM